MQLHNTFEVHLRMNLEFLGQFLFSSSLSIHFDLLDCFRSEFLKVSDGAYFLCIKIGELVSLREGSFAQ